MQQKRIEKAMSIHFKETHALKSKFDRSKNIKKNYVNELQCLILLFMYEHEQLK